MALYVKHSRGLVVSTGCGYACVENIMEYGPQVTDTDKLYAIIGGRTRLVVGTHCTGIAGIAALPTAAKSGLKPP
jgi:7,8-dihydropterin-6-yl-methyl-4-(beta-D-ribofuranosyl)aminobenzene 5'-phosphate synthase